ncbi:MAG: isoleucine--tRNA ligase [Opitutaceae bacterium]|nr:isoleucine--tRNA ligase [Opitutaceae bacterium]
MAKDFKDTLNLPKTDFPMRANLVSREPERIVHWSKTNIYEKVLQKNAEKPSFILHDGPPFTNGDIHLGHILNKTLKDIVLRYKSVRGFYTPYVPGWDSHGLPIEHAVSKELRKKKVDLDNLEIRKECQAFAEKYIDIQKEQFKRLAMLTNWDPEYRTISPSYEADILRTFAAFVEQGMVYRSKKPVYWSIPCKTALAEAEIEYKDHVSPSIWVKFKIPESAKIGVEGPLSAVIWTTTPWTIPSNMAIAVHPRLEYSILRSGEESYLVASALVEQFTQDVEIEQYETVKTVLGAELENIEARHPFIDRASPIVLAEYVTTESGTGCVHTAPGHGMDDYQTGLKYGLEIYSPLDDNGSYVDDGQIPADLVGISVLEKKGISPANKVVIEKLEAGGSLLRFKKISHSYPHCWRSKTPVVFRAMDQFFLDLDKNDSRKKVLAEIEKVNWIPSWGKNRILGAVKNRPDWCISRQRVWGVPLPAFFDEEKQAYLDTDVIKALADKIETQGGTNIWFEQSAEELLDGIDLPESWKGKQLSAGTDTPDVWFDSGSSHRAVLQKQPNLSWPADLYLEGSDQHRGWFQSSLWTGVIADGAAPYKTVLTHGFVVDKDGKKLSKSDGAKTATEWINAFGADILRLFIASQDYKGDLPISEKSIKHVADSYRLFRNTFRFQISNLYDFDLEKDGLPIDQLDPIDLWALAKTNDLIKQVEAAYDTYEFHRVYQLCNQFCSVTLSAVYHDILKDRLYTLAPDSQLRRSSQTAIHSIFNSMVRMLGPILAFTCDEAWAYASENKDFVDDCLVLQGWTDGAKIPADSKVPQEIDDLLKFRSLVYEQLEVARKAGEIGKSLEASVCLSGSGENPTYQLLSKNNDLLAELLIVSQVQLEAGSSSEITISVSRAKGDKCPRCWRNLNTLTESADTSELCSRCEEAIAHI